MPATPSPSDAPSLADLLVRCRRHEAAAQWALYQRFALPMLAVAKRYAPSVADAEDALQDAFIKIFQKLPDQREPAAFPGWVRRIVISTALDAWHRRRLRRTDFDLTDAHHVAAPEASVIEQLTMAEVKVLMDQLPAGCRLVLLLYTIEGYTHPEIAELLGIGESASKMQLLRARQRLSLLVEQANRERGPAPPDGAPAAPPATAPAPSPPAARAAPPVAPAPPFHPLTTLLLQ